MYNRGKVITGLVVFVLFFTSPFWYSMGKTRPEPKPELSPKAKQAKHCVEPTPYMKAFHMQLLDHWRYAAIRHGERLYIAGNGQRYKVSLQNTCLQCHTNKSKFCDQCHNYLRVKPYCWNCHIELEEKK